MVARSVTEWRELLQSGRRPSLTPGFGSHGQTWTRLKPEDRYAGQRLAAASASAFSFFSPIVASMYARALGIEAHAW